MLRSRRSLTQPYLLDYARTAKRMACVRCFVLHPFIRLLRAEKLLAVSERAAHAFANSVRRFALKRQNAVQKGFNALVHCFALCCLRHRPPKFHQLPGRYAALAAVVPPVAMAVEEVVA